MKKFLLSLLLAVSLNQTNAQILVNGGFENWTTVGLYLNPDGWLTTNGLSPNAIVLQGPGYSGNYAALLVSDSVGPGSYAGGQVSLHYSGNARPLSLSGYWKGNIAGVSDQAVATMYVYDALFNPIGYGSAYIFSTLTSWTPFNFTMTYVSGAEAATTDIIISLFSTSPNTNAFIDELTMSYVTSTNDLVTAPLPSATIIPGSGDDRLLLVDLLSKESFGVDVYNLHGQKVFTHQEAGFSGHHEIHIPAHLFAAGMYVCRVGGTGIKSSVKFSRE